MPQDLLGNAVPAKTFELLERPHAGPSVDHWQGVQVALLTMQSRQQHNQAQSSPCLAS